MIFVVSNTLTIRGTPTRHLMSLPNFLQVGEYFIFAVISSPSRNTRMCLDFVLLSSFSSFSCSCSCKLMEHTLDYSFSRFNLKEYVLANFLPLVTVRSNTLTGGRTSLVLPSIFALSEEQKIKFVRARVIFLIKNDSCRLPQRLVLP